MTLYHFTCADHGYRALGRRGMLKPNPHVLLAGSPALVWLTSLPMPDPDSVGLTMDNIVCDRLAYRYIVADEAGCEPWLSSRWRADSKLARPRIVADLERFGWPETWWVADHPVPARLG